MNVFLLLKVKEAILASPEHFDMGQWDCGTTACIAGWAARLSGLPLTVMPMNMRPDRYSARNIVGEWERTRGSLKISYEQWTRLVHSISWPEPFHQCYIDHYGDPKRKAQIAADRIDYFILTNGTDEEEQVPF